MLASSAHSPTYVPCPQVMNHGQVEEFDTPYNLLKIKSSLFYKMVDKTGPEASKELCNMVKTP